MILKTILFQHTWEFFNDNCLFSNSTWNVSSIWTLTLTYSKKCMILVIQLMVDPPQFKTQIRHDIALLNILVMKPVFRESNSFKVTVPIDIRKFQILIWNPKYSFDTTLWRTRNFPRVCGCLFLCNSFLFKTNDYY